MTDESSTMLDALHEASGYLAALGSLAGFSGARHVGETVDRAIAEAKARHTPPPRSPDPNSPENRHLQQSALVQRMRVLLATARRDLEKMTNAAAMDAENWEVADQEDMFDRSQALLAIESSRLTLEQIDAILTEPDYVCDPR